MTAMYCPSCNHAESGSAVCCPVCGYTEQSGSEWHTLTTTPAPAPMPEPFAAEMDEVVEPFHTIRALEDAAALDRFLFLDPNPATRVYRLRVLTDEMEQTAAHLRLLLGDFSPFDVPAELGGAASSWASVHDEGD